MSFVTGSRLPVETPQSATALLIQHFGSRAVMTLHDVAYAKRGPTIGTGRVFTHEDLAAFLAILAGQDYGLSLLPNNVLSASPAHLTWYVEGKKRPMWFQVKEGRTTKVTVHWPNLLFHVHNRVLWVFAYTGKERPNATTRLHHAPIMNVYTDGRVCTGNGSLPGSHDIVTMADWEKVIFDTLFTHVNHAATLQLRGKSKKGVTTAAHVAFWRKQAAARRFPISALIPHPARTLGRFFKGENRE